MFSPFDTEQAIADLMVARQAIEHQLDAASNHHVFLYAYELRDLMRRIDRMLAAMKEGQQGGQEEEEQRR